MFCIQTNPTAEIRRPTARPSVVSCRRPPRQLRSAGELASLVLKVLEVFFCGGGVSRRAALSRVLTAIDGWALALAPHVLGIELAPCEPGARSPWTSDLG